MPGFFRDRPEPLLKSLASCGLCGLSKKCHSPRMPYSGLGRRKILVVGEAPGEEEDKKGVQFVGKAGSVLRRSIKAINRKWSLEECWKTNAVICRPPKNVIDSRYIEACRPNLFRTIHELRPKVILLLGSSALASLLSQFWKDNLGPLAQWVGWTIPVRMFGEGVWLCPTYHPSYLARMNEEKALVRIFRRHLSRAFELADEPRPNPPTMKELERKIELIDSPRLMRKALRDLAKKEGILAFDYETNSLKPEGERCRIVSVSFCLNGEDTWAGLLDETCLKYLSLVLRRPQLRKIASNLKFEERWTRAILGHGVKGWWWDTMLAAHVLDNRMGITSIKFQAFIHYGVVGYEHTVAPYLRAKTCSGLNRISEIPPKELLLYNGLDSLLEYMVAMKQRKEMGCESDSV